MKETKKSNKKLTYKKRNKQKRTQNKKKNKIKRITQKETNNGFPSTQEYSPNQTNSIEEDESMTEQTLIQENSIKDQIVDNIDDLKEDCCLSTSLSNISMNIHQMNVRIATIDEYYVNVLNTQLDLAKQKVIDLVNEIILNKKHKLSEEDMQSLIRSQTLMDWFHSIKHKAWQTFQESDLLQSMRYNLIEYILIQLNIKDINDIKKNMDIINVDTIMSETSFKKVHEEYKYKIICGYFTKASISYAIYNYGKPYENIIQIPEQPYRYLENFAQLLNVSISSINYELQTQWGTFFKTPYDNSSYVVSGGNIFYLFAGILCYLNNNKEIQDKPMLNQITRDLYGSFDDIHNFQIYLNSLFTKPIFNNIMKEILSNVSDLDFLFLSKEMNLVGKEDNYAKEINALSCSILRTLLHKAKNNSSQFPLKYIFPFMDKYKKKTWGAGRMFNLSKLDKGDMDKINKHSKTMTEYLGYRQSSSYIQELPIYLNRIKQGYYPFNENAANENANEKNKGIGPTSIKSENIKDLQTKFGECIDLSIGFTENNLYRNKYEHYLKGEYYSMDCLLQELISITEGTSDDKSEKRTIRKDFLTILIESPFHDVFDIILSSIFKNIHKYGMVDYGYPFPQLNEDMNT